MKTAQYFHAQNEVVVCDLCPNSCSLKSGQHGLCHVRFNHEGQLIAGTYHTYASIAIDPIEKKPLFHFYPGERILSLGSLGCNMTCKHCQNWQISQPQLMKRQTQGYQLSPADILTVLEDEGLNFIAFTYNEPFVAIENLLEAGPVLKNAGYRTALVTNGFICPEPLAALIPFYDAWSIDLKAFNSKSYQQLTGTQGFETVKNTIQTCVAAKKHVELTTNLVSGINDGLKQLSEMAEWIAAIDPAIPWHITSFFPTFKFADRPLVAPDIPKQATDMALAKGLYHVYSSSREHTYCHFCGQLLIKRNRFQVTNQAITLPCCSSCGREANCLYV